MNRRGRRGYAEDTQEESNACVSGGSANNARMTRMVSLCVSSAYPLRASAVHFTACHAQAH